MSDFLGRLAGRVLGTEVPLRPRVASRFEPETSPPDPLSHRTPLPPGEGGPLAVLDRESLPLGPIGASPTVETPRGASPAASPASPGAAAPGAFSATAPASPAAKFIPRDIPKEPRVAAGTSGGGDALGDAPRGVSTVGGISSGQEDILGPKSAPLSLPAHDDSGTTDPGPFPFSRRREVGRLESETAPATIFLRGHESERARPSDESKESAGGGSLSPGGTGGRWERGPGGEVPGRAAVSSSEASPATPAVAPPIRVTIGRIEVKATAPAPPPAPARPVAGPRMNLEDYLRRRREGKL